MFRLLVYIGFGWLLAAAVPSLAAVLQLTVMLPSTTAIVLVYLAFAGPREGIGTGVAIALALGYLEDLHQGAPTGTLTLAHALMFIVLYRVALRIALPGPVSRIVGTAAAVVALDVATWAILTVLADAYDLHHGALNLALADVGWHAIATGLATYPVWFMLDLAMSVFRVRPRVADPRFERGR